MLEKINNVNNINKMIIPIIYAYIIFLMMFLVLFF